MAQMMNYKKLGRGNRVLGVIGLILLAAILIKLTIYILF